MTGICRWDVLVLTCKTNAYAKAAQDKLQRRKQLGYLPQDLIILCIEDPQDGIGSGGATLNALLTLTEHLSAQHGFTVVTSDVLKHSRVLMMHSGRYFPFDPCCRSFVSLPLLPVDREPDYLVTNFDALYHLVTIQLAHDTPPGLWICSCDMMLSFPQQFKFDWKNVDVGDGILGFSVPAPVDYAINHGVYAIDENCLVKDLIFQGSVDDISKCCRGGTTVPLVSGIVFFSVFATERLLTTHVTPPLDACTYLGIDSGMEPVCISLYFDILLATASDVKENDFIKGERSGIFGKSDSPLTGQRKAFMKNARSVLWKHIHDLQFKVNVIECGKHCYLDMHQTPLDYCSTLRVFCPLLPGYKFSLHVHSFIHEEAKLSDTAMVINSVIDQGVTIGENTVIMHSFIASGVVIGNDCYVHGLDEVSSKQLPANKVSDGTFLIGMSVEFQKNATKRYFVCLPSDVGVLHKQLIAPQYRESADSVKKCQSDLINFAIENSSVLPFSYRNVLATRKNSEHLKTLYMAKIFPVYHLKHVVDVSHSMQLYESDLHNCDYDNWHDYLRSSFCDILENVDYSSEFDYQMELYLNVASRRISRILTKNFKTSLLPFFKMFVLCNQHTQVLELLDQLAVEAVDQSYSVERRPDVSARAFACIADVLGFMSKNKGGLRSGPAANKQWRNALSLLEKGELKRGVKMLSKMRKIWLHHPDLLIRAARHYEGAEQILIRHAVMTVSSFIHTSTCYSLKPGTWHVAECPARIDLAGGWTDTPPVCYEYGGCVVNAAILLNGQRPIGARIRKLDDCIIFLKLLGDSETDTQEIVCSSLSQLADYNTPQAPGALLKACIVLAQIVRLDSEMTLQEQLKKNFEGGFELQTWSHLPRGSGLGTSSILASAILRIVFEASGKLLDQDSLIHAVLLVEQMLTTGGGWQDQVGGIGGGFKAGRSAAKLPLQVATDFLLTSEDFYGKFSDHLKLIYTGKTRLARNLLQNVIRNWYTKRPEILNCCHDLKDNAEQCARSVMDEDLELIGKHMNAYWEQKKSIASGCEPDLCRRMMDVLRPYSYGMSLAGAGGGGFMYVLTKKPFDDEFISSLLGAIEGAQDAVVYDVAVDRIGMTCYCLSV